MTHNVIKKLQAALMMAATLSLSLSCGLGDEPEGLHAAKAAATTVKFDFFHRPLPEIPLPNDLATRYDAKSATGRRINASMVAPTAFESRTRKLIDELDGWGIMQPITIPFSGPLSIQSIWDGHRKDKNYDLKDDVVYLINVDPKSKSFGKVHHLDLGHGNYPVVLESLDKYWKNGPRDWTLSLLYEEADEDTNGNGKMDPGEDTDGDGELDKPNYLPKDLLASKALPKKDDLAGRADAIMTFYERQSNTLILRPMEPLDERTTYAVVITRRLNDADGKPVGSPFPYINHSAQNGALAPLAQVLPDSLTLDDVAFAFAYTTQSVESHFQAVRDGLYGHGVQKHLAKEFPARLTTVYQGKDYTWPAFSGMKNPFIVHTEHFLGMFKTIAAELLGMKKDSVEYKLAFDHLKYVDYHVMGSFPSPQLFERKDAKGHMLPYDLQSWPADLDRKKAKARSEEVHFWMTIPRKEVSARGSGKPVPVVIISHGYGGDRTDCLALGGLMAKFGMACLAIDGPSHGLDLGQTDYQLALLGAGANGIKAFLEGAFKSRALDQNHDGKRDSGADFWSAYVFHTRDMVRQFALDYMQLIRVFRSFDGKRTWDVKLSVTEKTGKKKTLPPGDLNGDGQKELAGDFDGDGQVDVGGPNVKYYMTGGSLGGIMSMAVGGLEPHLTAIAPVAGGAGLGDVGIRSRQGGVPEAFILRVMGPLFAGTLDLKSTDGQMKLETIVPDLNSTRTKHFATIKGAAVGDTLVVTNLETKEHGCSIVDAKGLVRAAVAADGPVRCTKAACPKPYQCTGEEKDPSDAKGEKKVKYHYYGDKLKVSLYKGNVVVGKECKLKEGVKPKVEVSTFEQDVTFQHMTCEKGKPLVALTEGLGKRRAHPDLRRFAAFAMFVAEPGDPAAYVRHMSQKPLVYPGTKEKTGTHALIITTAGDMNVPASSGVTAGRAAGLIEYLRDDKRYGKSQNKMLIDTYTAEAVDVYKRYKNASTGAGVHIDVENFSSGTDMWGQDVPRLDKPMRLGFDKKDRLGGQSAAIFPLTNPTGQHGFDAPGAMTDKAISQCKVAKKKDCDTLKTYDVGLFLYNMIGQYFADDGQKLTSDLCLSRNDCKGWPAPPKSRDDKSVPY